MKQPWQRFASCHSGIRSWNSQEYCDQASLSDLFSYPGSGVVSGQQPGEAGANAVLQDGRGGRRRHLRQRGELICLLLSYNQMFIFLTLQHETTLFLISPQVELLFFDASPPSLNQSIIVETRVHRVSSTV